LSSLDSDFANYLWEKEGKHTFNMGEGFFVWKVLPEFNEFWVCFLYIKPEYRCGLAFVNAMTQIKAMGEVYNCKQIVADIDIRNNGSDEVLSIFLKRGMKVGKIEDNCRIWLYYPLINNSNEEVSHG
jgi:hypothetical protein